MVTRLQRYIGVAAFSLSISVTGCNGTLLEWFAQHPLELNNVTADNIEWLTRNPEAADMLEQQAIPQDSRLHFSGNIERLHDKKTGAAIGWEFDVAAKVSLPLCDKGPCGPTGDSKEQYVQALDQLKNRVAPPNIISQSITLEEMLQPGDDRIRFRPDEGATITGYVADVLPGGMESCNCHAANLLNRDTHIILVAAQKDAKKRRRHVIVEVTPRVRKFHPGWTTDRLRVALKGKRVTFTGWMFFDEEHAQNSFNTAPRGSVKGNTGSVWRATAWEIHPVTDISVTLNPTTEALAQLGPAARW